MTKIEITVLGTASMIPTKERNLTSVFLSYEKQGILFDCGEGTQRQLKLAGIKPNKINKILISHWHGDHVLGLPGLLQTLGNSDYVKKLDIYGPVGTKKYFECMLKGFAYDTNLDLEVHDIKDGTIFENKDFFIESKKMEHGVLCMGYAFVEKDKRKIIKSKVKGVPGKKIGELQKGKSIEHEEKIIHPDDVSHIEKGKKVSFIVDTEICTNAARLCNGSDLLLCESTYLSDLEEKGQQYKHMTAEQAALLASNNNVKELVLCHFSGRYKTTEALEEEAKAIFPNTRAAFDLMKIKL